MGSVSTVLPNRKFYDRHGTSALPRGSGKRSDAGRAGLRWVALLLIATAPLGVFGGENLGISERGTEPPFENLTLGNFFSRGWNEPWTRRSRGEGTPDMSLLRVQTNFLAQLFRTDLAIQQNLSDNPIRETYSLSGTLEYAFNRRFMLAVIGTERWLDARAGEDNDGATVAAFARFQWVDTATSSLATTIRVGWPSRDLDEKQTTLGFSLAGWQDLAPIGLQRVGLYYHVQEETFAGPGKAGGRRNDLTYDISLAKTWTRPDAGPSTLSTRAATCSAISARRRAWVSSPW